MNDLKNGMSNEYQWKEMTGSPTLLDKIMDKIKSDYIRGIKELQALKDEYIHEIDDLKEELLIGYDPGKEPPHTELDTRLRIQELNERIMILNGWIEHGNQNTPE